MSYKICPLSDENNNCIDSCPYGKKVFINSQRTNFCGGECPNYIMMPNEICIDECDENIFIKKTMWSMQRFRFK